MRLTPQAQATLLLTLNFGKADKADAKPLSNNEWGRFAAWLRHNSLTPADLLDGSIEILRDINDRTITAMRIQTLLGRGTAVGLALEKWERAGLWVLTRADQEYPEKLKRRLRASSPPVLFGCGNKALLNKGGLAVVGSRNASDEDLTFTAHLGELTASQGFSIISGGARGVDDAAMTGTLDKDGTGIAVLADSLLRTATASRFRRPLISGDLVLISPFNPEAGFFAGSAMARNKYIYCLADAAIVISSITGKGGTWTGAVEAIKHGWVPLWIKATSEPNSGNPQLVELGANWLPSDLECIASLSISPALTSVEGGHDGDQIADSNARFADCGIEGPSGISLEADEAGSTKAPETSLGAAAGRYDLFIEALASMQSQLPCNVKEISAKLGMRQADVTKFLKKGIDQGIVEKLAKPVRFRFASAQPQQTSFL